jgi:Spy/CpxP family protein refolding chaperone
MNRFIRRLAIPALALSLVAGAALGGVAYADPPQAAGNGAQHHRGNRRAHRGGGDGDEALIEYSLHNLNLNGPERSQVEQLQQGLRPSREAVRNARKDLLSALAPEVSSGNVDAATLQSKVDALAAAEAGERAAEDAAVDRLHGILDTTQRAELANGIEARMTAREQAHQQHQAQHAANATNAQNGSTPNAHAHGQRTPGGRLARELSLTPAQTQQVESILQAERSSVPRPDFAAMRAQRTAMLEAFKGQSFSASSFRTVDPAAHARAGASRFIETAQKITQVLTAEQRATAGQKMQAAAAHGRMAI